MSRVICGMCLSLAVLVASEASAEQKSVSRAATYGSLQSLPDWSGWWGLEGPMTVEFQRAPPPLKPELLATMRSVFTGDAGGLRDLYCRPSQFTGYSGGFVESIEFLFTPGRVTLTNESGLVRRIYTDGRTMPREVEATNAGTSVGHWEGQTLVVETSGINPKALYPQAFTAAIPVGKNVRITERIALLDPGTLQFEITTTAPDILTAPDKRTRTYSRVPKHAALEISFCTDFDRAVDPNTGRQRLDLTPPADLPPPPPAR